jgi:hypothetical protein
MLLRARSTTTTQIKTIKARNRRVLVRDMPYPSFFAGPL